MTSSSVTLLSWNSSEAVTGPMKLSVADNHGSSLKINDLMSSTLATEHPVRPESIWARRLAQPFAVATQ
jgi:hypothetical protein